MPVADLRLIAAECGDGIEEEKEECLDIATDAMSGAGGEPPSPDAVGDEHGFRAQLDSFARALFGGCGSVMEAAVHTCRVWPISPPPQHRPAQYPIQPHDPRRHPAPLSIADELRRLAAHNPYLAPQHPRGDIPKFLGEDAVYSFEDDNISAISAHTLEEMEQRHRQKLLMPSARCRPSEREANTTPPPQPSSESRQSQDEEPSKEDDHAMNPPPSPTRTRSASTSTTTHSSKSPKLKA